MQSSSSAALRAIHVSATQRERCSDDAWMLSLASDNVTTDVLHVTRIPFTILACSQKFQILINALAIACHRKLQLEGIAGGLEIYCGWMFEGEIGAKFY